MQPLQMERLPVEVVSQVLASLSACEIASLVSCGKAVHSLVASMGCLSTSARYVKAVSDVASYRRRMLLGPAAGTVGGVTFRPSVPHYRSFLARRVVLQSLVVQGERDAGKWLALTYAMPLSCPNRPASLSLFRNVPWDFTLYTILCNALELCSLPRLYLTVSSVPAIEDGGERLPLSSQAFLSHLLCGSTTTLLHLNICGAAQGSPPLPVPEGFVDRARRRVDAVFEEAARSADDLRVYPLHDFRSSTISLGRVLVTANPRLRSLKVSCYAFDEVAPSVDVVLLSSYLEWGAHELVRVNLHRVKFGSGGGFCRLLKALCKVPSLHWVSLSAIECLTDPPEDPLAILFDMGSHIGDLRLKDVARVPANVPFHSIKAPGQHSLALKQMFLNTVHLHPMLAALPLLPTLVHVDLSCNGIDGGALRLFARVLKERACNIERLKLASNIITGSAVPFFCQALQVNRSLCALDIGDNFLGTQSSLKILQTVVCTHASRVRYLNLDTNQVRYRVEDLSRILLAVPQKSAVLRQVSLRGNPRMAARIGEDKDTRKNDCFKAQYNVSFLF